MMQIRANNAQAFSGESRHRLNFLLLCVFPPQNTLIKIENRLSETARPSLSDPLMPTPVLAGGGGIFRGGGGPCTSSLGTGPRSHKAGPAPPQRGDPLVPRWPRPSRGFPAPCGGQGLPNPTERVARLPTASGLSALRRRRRGLGPPHCSVSREATVASGIR